ncbi:MAG: hypothetical protein AAFV19_08385 [Pseudomonadota bacterium]
MEATASSLTMTYPCPSHSAQVPRPSQALQISVTVSPLMAIFRQPVPLQNQQIPLLEQAGHNSLLDIEEAYQIDI